MAGPTRTVTVGDIWEKGGKEVQVVENNGHGLIRFHEIKDKTKSNLIWKEGDFRTTFKYCRSIS